MLSSDQIGSDTDLEAFKVTCTEILFARDGYKDKNNYRP